MGPILVSYFSTIAASAAGCTSPFSTSRLSRARTRNATSFSDGSYMAYLLDLRK